MAEIQYVSRRFWTYRRDKWDPAWYQKLGVPYVGGDEWGRRTIVVGLWFVGYVVWAWRTCWCQECHEIREQTYRMLNEDSADLAAARESLASPARRVPIDEVLDRYRNELIEGIPNHGN